MGLFPLGETLAEEFALKGSLFWLLLIEESVKALSGRTFRRIIRTYTNGRLRAIGSGALVTALLQSSSAVSLMVLAFVGAGVMSMQNAIGVIMGSNIGTTITVLLGAIGGAPTKKRVSLSHLIFNVVTGVAALAGLPAMVGAVSMVVDIGTNSLTGLALFHTLFNIAGVVLFFPFLGLFSKLLIRIYPDQKTILTVYIDQTPPEVTDAAIAALRKEIGHLLQEGQLYNLRLLRIDEKLVFDADLPFENGRRRKYTLDELYENIKLLHAEILTFYSGIQIIALNETEAKDLERLIYASRNMMNAIKNFKGVRHNMEEFDGSDNPYLNIQYKLFRKRIVELYLTMGRILGMDSKEDQYRSLLTAFIQIEEADNLFINNTMEAVAGKKIQEMEIASLVLVNRLFTQSCRMQIYGMKDLLLTQEQITHFDRAMDTKDVVPGRKTN